MLSPYSSTWTRRNTRWSRSGQKNRAVEERLDVDVANLAFYEDHPHYVRTKCRGRFGARRNRDVASYTAAVPTPRVTQP